MRKKTWRGWAITGGVAVLALGTLTGLLIGSKTIRDKIFGATDAIVQKDYTEEKSWEGVEEFGLKNLAFAFFANGIPTYADLKLEDLDSSNAFVGFGLYEDRLEAAPPHSPIAKIDSELLRIPAKITIKKGDTVTFYEDQIDGSRKYKSIKFTFGSDDGINLTFNQSTSALAYDSQRSTAVAKHVYVPNALRNASNDLTDVAAYRNLLGDAEDFCYHPGLCDVDVADGLLRCVPKCEKLRFVYDSAAVLDPTSFSSNYLKEIYLDGGFARYDDIIGPWGVPNANVFFDFKESEMPEGIKSTIDLINAKGIYFKGSFVKIGNSYQPIAGKEPYSPTASSASSTSVSSASAS